MAAPSSSPRGPTNRSPTVTVDRAGRVLLPKALRERLGLRHGATLWVGEQDGVVLLEPTYLEVEPVRSGRVTVLRPTTPVEPTDAELTRDVIDELRR